MPNTFPMNNPSGHKAYVITGPISGIGRPAVLEVSKHGKVVLVGRDREKLGQLQKDRAKGRPRGAASMQFSPVRSRSPAPINSASSAETAVFTPFHQPLLSAK